MNCMDHALCVIFELIGAMFVWYFIISAFSVFLIFGGHCDESVETKLEHLEFS